jgi:hypothetical protein
MSYLYYSRPIEPERLARVIQMYSERCGMRAIMKETRLGEKKIREIVRNAGVFREPKASRKMGNGGIGGHSMCAQELASKSSRIFMIGFSEMPAWAVPYVEAGRVYEGMQS